MSVIIIASPPYVATEIITARVQETSRDARGAMRQTEGRRYGHGDGNLANLKPGGLDAAISSPPYEVSLSSTRNGIDEAKYRYTRSALGQHGNVKDEQRYSGSSSNLGNSKGETFWTAAKQIVAQSHAVLKDGAYCAWVVKAYVREGKVVNFPAQWRALCEHIGFETIECIRAWVVEDQGTRVDFDGKAHKKIVARKSFFRRLHERKHPETAIDYEVVWIMRKAAP